MNKSIFNFFYMMVLVLSLLFLFGCGEKTAPDPPEIKSQTVLETYRALENGDHDIALKKISRLRELEPGNVFLANLEVLERNNSIIKAAQIKINEDDIKGALGVVSEGIQKYGRHDDLMNVQKKLKIITKIEEILKVFKAPRDSEKLSGAAMQLKKISEIYKPAAIFLPLSHQKIAEAAVMHDWEMHRAVIDLVSQINDLQVEEDRDVDLLYAILENVDPTNSVLINYLEYINGNEDVDLIVYPEENIFETHDETEKGSDSTENTSLPDDKKMDEDKQKDEDKQTEEKKGGWWNKFSF